MSAHYYDQWRELASQAWGSEEPPSAQEHPSVRFAIDEACDALQDYANEGGIGWDALDALEAAEEFFRGASLGIQGER